MKFKHLAQIFLSLCLAVQLNFAEANNKYDEANKPVITNLKRVSKPGLRNYCKAKNLPQVLGGMGVAVVSTSKGLLTDRKARKENLGGEVLCYIY